MSSWLTLNIEGIAPSELPEAFSDWWVYEKNGITVAYSFNPNMSPEEAAAEAVKVGEHPVESDVDSVLTLRCNDTSDFVQATIYRPREVKWNGVRPGVTWSGHHSWGSDDSEFLERAPSGPAPVFAGNWTEEYGEDSPAELLSDRTRDSDTSAEPE